MLTLVCLNNRSKCFCLNNISEPNATDFPETYLGPCQTSMTGVFFAKTVNNFYLLAIFAKKQHHRCLRRFQIRLCFTLKNLVRHPLEKRFVSMLKPFWPNRFRDRKTLENSVCLRYLMLLLNLPLLAV